MIFDPLNDRFVHQLAGSLTSPAGLFLVPNVPTTTNMLSPSIPNVPITSIKPEMRVLL